MMEFFHRRSSLRLRDGRPIVLHQTGLFYTIKDTFVMMWFGDPRLLYPSIVSCCSRSHEDSLATPGLKGQILPKIVPVSFHQETFVDFFYPSSFLRYSSLFTQRTEWYERHLEKRKGNNSVWLLFRRNRVRSVSMNGVQAKPYFVMLLATARQESETRRRIFCYRRAFVVSDVELFVRRRREFITKNLCIKNG